MQQSTDRLVHPRLNLIEERLGGNLAAYVAQRRGVLATDPVTSWRALATELFRATGVEVSGEALRLWWNRPDAQAPAALAGRGTGS